MSAIIIMMCVEINTCDLNGISLNLTAEGDKILDSGFIQPQNSSGDGAHAQIVHCNLIATKRARKEASPTPSHDPGPCGVLNGCLISSF
jgi:hypothetical protein